MKTQWLLAGLLAAWLLSACRSPVFTSPPTTPASPIATPLTIVPESPLALPTPARPQRAVQQAVLDLTLRLNVDSSAIQIETLQPDEFPAGDLGCPQPGETALPMPAFVTGQRIILKVGDARYEYRAAGTQIVYCGIN
jgi:hypothetical protein